MTPERIVFVFAAVPLALAIGFPAWGGSTGLLLLAAPCVVLIGVSVVEEARDRQ